MASILNRLYSILPYGCEIKNVVPGVVYLVSNLPKAFPNCCDTPAWVVIFCDPESSAIVPNPPASLVVETGAISFSIGKCKYKRCCSFWNLFGSVFNILAI